MVWVSRVPVDDCTVTPHASVRKPANAEVLLGIKYQMTSVSSEFLLPVFSSRVEESFSFAFGSFPGRWPPLR